MHVPLVGRGKLKKQRPQHHVRAWVRRGGDRLSRLENLPFRRYVLVILCARFVLKHFAVDFIDQQINRGVKILFRRCAVNIFAANMQSDFCVMF